MEGFEDEVLMNNIGKVVDDDPRLLIKLKICSRQMLSEQQRERITMFIQLVEELRYCGKEDRLIPIFKACDREDLATALETRNVGNLHILPVQETQQVAITGSEGGQITGKVVDFLCNRLGNNWRKLARKLGFSEADIQNFEYHRHLDLEEISRNMLGKWMQREAGQATLTRLVECLQAADLNRLAGQIEREEYLPG